VAVKAAALLHKSDAGGVVLHVTDAEALEETIDRLRERLGNDARELAIESMMPTSEGVELIVGCRWDARFGPLLTVGMGGVFAELLADTQTVLAPVGEEAATDLVRTLRGAPLLAGMRGRPPLDVTAAGRAASVVSRFAAAHPEVAAVEVNPLLVLPRGAVGLDARLVLLGDGPDPTSDAPGRDGHSGESAAGSEAAGGRQESQKRGHIERRSP